jgi:hypothetical protein
MQTLIGDDKIGLNLLNSILLLLKHPQPPFAQYLSTHYIILLFFYNHNNKSAHAPNKTIKPKIANILFAPYFITVRVTNSFLALAFKNAWASFRFSSLCFNFSSKECSFSSYLVNQYLLGLQVLYQFSKKVKGPMGNK